MKYTDNYTLRHVKKNNQFLSQYYNSIQYSLYYTNFLILDFKNPELQNIHVPFYSLLPSFAHHPISWRTTRYGRSIIPDRYIGQLFSSRIPPHSLSFRRAERRTHASIDKDDRVAWHSINRTKTNNVRHACELWTGCFSPPSRLHHALLSECDYESRGGPDFLFPPLFRKRIPSRGGRIMGRGRGGRDFEREIAFPNYRTRSFSRAFSRLRQSCDELFARGSNCVNRVGET